MGSSSNWNGWWWRLLHLHLVNLVLPSHQLLYSRDTHSFVFSGPLYYMWGCFARAAAFQPMEKDGQLWKETHYFAKRCFHPSSSPMLTPSRLSPSGIPLCYCSTISPSLCEIEINGEIDIKSWNSEHKFLRRKDLADTFLWKSVILLLFFSN